MCKDCKWEDLLNDIESMLDGEEFEWAVDTLEGIQEWVSENEHCTEAQRRAVSNIKAARSD
jgi:hypothetical protein